MGWNGLGWGGLYAVPFIIKIIPTRHACHSLIKVNIKSALINFCVLTQIHTYKWFEQQIRNTGIFYIKNKNTRTLYVGCWDVGCLHFCIIVHIEWKRRYIFLLKCKKTMRQNSMTLKIFVVPSWIKYCWPWRREQWLNCPHSSITPFCTLLL